MLEESIILDLQHTHKKYKKLYKKIVDSEWYDNKGNLHQLYGMQDKRRELSELSKRMDLLLALLENVRKENGNVTRI